MLLKIILSDKVRKIAFFDFCETLISFQTADAFVDFVRRVRGSLGMNFINTFSVILEKVKVTLIFNKLFPDKSIEKRLKLLQLRGFTFDELNDLAKQYYQEMVRPCIIKPVIEELMTLREDDYEICLVSAGYSIYLQYFADEYHIKDVISTEIAFNDLTNICKGTISGKDCINNEKINRIKAYYEGQDIDYNQCISYSDSRTDLPVLLFTGKGVVISKNKPQKWCSQYKFKEIIWE